MARASPISRSKAVVERGSFSSWKHHDAATEASESARRGALPIALAIVLGTTLLTVGGVYAITLFGVLARRKEFGVRAAIGASPVSLAMLATRSSLTPVLIGGIAGAALTVPAARLTAQLDDHQAPRLAAALVLALKENGLQFTGAPLLGDRLPNQSLLVKAAWGGRRRGFLIMCRRRRVVGSRG